ncbi:MAG: ornithine carbamoyltransferase [bacterium]
MPRHLLSLLDLSREEILAVLHRAREMKKGPGIYRSRILEGKAIGLLFEKSSTRTRVSFEVGAYDLGAHTIFLTPGVTQIGRGEPVKDTARVLSRYVDAIVLRTGSQSILEEYAKWSTIPVINALSDLLHPCQILADLLTILEKRGSLDGLEAAYVGDGNNVAHSWILASARLGFRFRIATPPGYAPADEVLGMLDADARSRVLLTRDPIEAVRGAHAISTDVWVSMGQEAERAERLAALASYQLDAALVSHAAPDTLVLHCLPAHRGEEITDEVIEGPRSVVFDQAENRLHAQKALLEFLMAEPEWKKRLGPG